MKRKWGIFFQSKLALLSLAGLFIALLGSLGAEWIANNKPYVLRYRGHWYLPILSAPSASALGIEGAFQVDFKKLELSSGDWAWFPPVRFDPYESNTEVNAYPSAPSRVNPLGTDDRGRDVFARLLYGFRLSLLYALGTWVITYALGTMLGLAMGFFGGWVDFLGQRAVEVLSSVPQFFLLILLIAIFEPGMTLLVVVTSAFGWIPISYYIRAEALTLRKREFIEAARAIGVPLWRVLFKHLLPNALTPILTFSPFAIAAGITGLAALDYLGFGLSPPTPSWGELLNQAKKNFTTAWWLAFFPSLALFATLSALAFVGEGLRNSFDPRRG